MAASGECGGGLGAVAPAVGDEGPQQVAAAVLAALVPFDEVGEDDDVGLEEVLDAAAAGESPTTSISSSSSRTSTTTGGGGGGGGGDGGEGEPDDAAGLGAMVVGAGSGVSSTRSGHG